MYIALQIVPNVSRTFLSLLYMALCLSKCSQNMEVFNMQIPHVLTAGLTVCVSSSVVMTTTPDNLTYQTTTGNVIPSSPLHGIVYYFESTIVFIGIVGTAANAFILYAMVASKQHKKQVLIFNQNSLDLFSSILLVIRYGAKLCRIPLVGSVGKWLCKWLLSENILWCGILAAKNNLVLVTIERYLKVVHRGFSKQILRSSVVYSAAAFSWIFGFALSIGITLTTTEVVGGICYAYVFWSSPESQLAYGIWYFLFYFVFIIARLRNDLSVDV